MMKISILLVIILFTIHNVCQASQHDCIGLIYALNHCESYTCDIDFIDDKIQYTVFGMRNGRCKFFEQDSSSVMLCHLPKEKLEYMSEYLVKVVTNNVNVDIDKVGNMLSSVCEFYSVVQESVIPENEEVTEENALEIERTAGLKKRESDIRKIKSIFFPNKDVEALHSIYMQNTRKSEHH
ncbi:hypothetical protein FDZ58_00815 [Ehrlichia ruminantium]|uniref:Uncharacterized protein n=2 Tax=Ehrlichia ruminantium TaxID=779 RepID=A0A0H3LYP2_EHRRW|nr:hypothetical protein FDZ68_00815 [Ehrlichia ruminantium]CAH57862.1 putative exported protein [Ehrlichia ruminantium str. Welgevonden]QLK51147.1 hypothetical protein FDZ66_00820 [Ehrlichia ruminantium]QLK52070.1 hypothetical protein FDZ65_00820 [Ehrlichia ruminantium]QLK52981.1 hypothetical protein FDZ64_00815 [Ehrlichia ruminantium]